MESTNNNLRSTERISPSNPTITVHGIGEKPMLAAVLDESFGGIGIAVPIEFKDGKSLCSELSVDLSGVRTAALVRHASALPSGCRSGLEWKAQALSRSLRDLLSADNAAQKHKALIRILPAGISTMWKLYEAGRWEHMIAGADRLKKESAACQVHELCGPIDQFQAEVRAATEHSKEIKVRLEVKAALDQLIRKCVEVIRE